MTTGTNEVLQYFYASCILFVPVFCGLERTCPPHVKLQGRRGTCGSQLTQLISVACMFRGGYNTGVKRSSSGQTKHLEPDSIAVIEANANDTATEPKILEDFKDHLKQQLVSKRQAVSFLIKKSEYDEQGIVCECCYYRCSFREITDYCRDDGDDFFKRSLPGKAGNLEREDNTNYIGHTKNSDKGEIHSDAH